MDRRSCDKTFQNIDFFSAFKVAYNQIRYSKNSIWSCYCTNIKESQIERSRKALGNEKLRKKNQMTCILILKTLNNQVSTSSNNSNQATKNHCKRHGHQKMRHLEICTDRPCFQNSNQNSRNRSVIYLELNNNKQIRLKVN